MPTFWLSFAPEEGPARVILIDAADQVVACVKAHAMQICRPGDELLILQMAPDDDERRLPRNRVLTDEELQSVGAMKLGDVDPDVS